MARGKKMKVGLALGGGGARGFAHIGVLEVLDREGINIDMIAGTSAGAIVGALYAQGKSGSEIKSLALDIASQRLVSLLDPALPKSGFIKGNKIKNLIASFLGGNIKFSNLRIPFACVAADINTGEEVVINRGSVPEAIRASISIPVVFSLVKRDNRYLVDGGLVNPVPASIVKRMGADIVIAVNVVPDIADTVSRDDKGRQKSPKELDMVHILLQYLNITSNSLVKTSLELADVIIEPNTAHIKGNDYHDAQEGILQGELAAQKSVLEIKQMLIN